MSSHFVAGVGLCSVGVQQPPLPIMRLNAALSAMRRRDENVNAGTGNGEPAVGKRKRDDGPGPARANSDSGAGTALAPVCEHMIVS